MPLEDLAEQIPNRLHDTMVARLTVDFVARTAVLDVSLSVGDLESDDQSVREAHRSAAITLRGLQFCALDPPDPLASFVNNWNAFVHISALDAAIERKELRRAG